VRRTLSYLPPILWLLVAALLVTSFAVRIIWGSDLREFEDRLFEALGVPAALRYILMASLLGFSWYGIFVAERSKAAAQGRPVVRRSVAYVSLGALAIAVLVLFAGR
jgi:hypothetical protein